MPERDRYSRLTWRLRISTTSLTLQVVEVREVDPPAAEAPVVWRLVTTEPIDTEAQVAAVVDAYCQRWLIEEFFKAV